MSAKVNNNYDYYSVAKSWLDQLGLLLHSSKDAVK